MRRLPSVKNLNTATVNQIERFVSKLLQLRNRKQMSTNQMTSTFSQLNNTDQLVYLMNNEDI